MSRYNIACLDLAVAYPGVIPKLWHQTIQAHRREVRDAILDTTAALVAQHGLRAVTMSQIAEEAGIGRATLYKYFSGVEPILIAWHNAMSPSTLSSSPPRGMARGAPRSGSVPC